MEWRIIEEFPNYQINENGDIKSFRNNKVITNKLNHGGYHYVGLWYEGKLHSRLVHRLVAQTFIPNPDNKPQVNHVDSNKINNHVSNLEWCTQKENMKHRTEHEVNTKRVRQYDLEGNFIEEFKSLTIAASFIGSSKGTLSNACLGRKKTCKGYIWRFSEN